MTEVVGEPVVSLQPQYSAGIPKYHQCIAWASQAVLIIDVRTNWKKLSGTNVSIHVQFQQKLHDNGRLLIKSRERSINYLELAKDIIPKKKREKS